MKKGRILLKHYFTEGKGVKNIKVLCRTLVFINQMVYNKYIKIKGIAVKLDKGLHIRGKVLGI